MSTRTILELDSDAEDILVWENSSACFTSYIAFDTIVMRLNFIDCRALNRIRNSVKLTTTLALRLFLIIQLVCNVRLLLQRRKRRGWYWKDSAFPLWWSRWQRTCQYSFFWSMPRRLTEFPVKERKFRVGTKNEVSDSWSERNAVARTKYILHWWLMMFKGETYFLNESSFDWHRTGISTISISNKLLFKPVSGQEREFTLLFSVSPWYEL